MWTLQSGHEFLSSITPAIITSGYSACIVGSIVTTGRSPKDLGILLEQVAEEFTGEGYDYLFNVLINMGARWIGTSNADGDDLDTWRLVDGRIVDIFFGAGEGHQFFSHHETSADLRLAA